MGLNICTYICMHGLSLSHIHTHTLFFALRELSGTAEGEQLAQQLMATASALATPLPGYTHKRKRIPYTLVEASKGNR